MHALNPSVLASILLLASSSACTEPRAPSAARDPESWRRAGADLDALRAEAPKDPFVARVAVVMHSEKAAATFQARGALAVDPGRAMRIVLVGPGGATAFDCWVTNEKWKLAIPPLDKHEEGTLDPLPDKGLPVRFFRWWFLRPFAGRLIAGDSNERDTNLVLRDDTTTVQLDVDKSRPRHLVAIRKTEGLVERLDATFVSLTPSTNDRARYAALREGFEVDVQIEALEPHRPDPAAFDEPETL